MHGRNIARMVQTDVTGGEGLVQPWRRRLNVILQPEALAGTSGTTFQSFVAHIMPPSPSHHRHINMLTLCHHWHCTILLKQLFNALQADTVRLESS